MNQLKLLIASSTLLFLSGCSVLDAYLAARYDNQEYAIINQIRTQAELNIVMCEDTERSKQNITYLYNKSVEFKNFTQYIPRNESSYSLSEKLLELTKQAKELYDKNTTVSAGFCKLKLQQIQRSAESIQSSIGSKNR